MGWGTGKLRIADCGLRIGGSALVVDWGSCRCGGRGGEMGSSGELRIADCGLGEARWWWIGDRAAVGGTGRGDGELWGIADCGLRIGGSALVVDWGSCRCGGRGGEMGSSGELRIADCGVVSPVSAQTVSQTRLRIGGSALVLDWGSCRCGGTGRGDGELWEIADCGLRSCQPCFRSDCLADSAADWGKRAGGGLGIVPLWGDGEGRWGALGNCGLRIAELSAVFPLRLSRRLGCGLGEGRVGQARV